jgi:hypothetical protein
MIVAAGKNQHANFSRLEEWDGVLGNHCAKGQRKRGEKNKDYRRSGDFWIHGSSS